MQASVSAGAIRRAFVDLPFGQVHYRTAGAGSPVVMIHASPGSSRQLEPLVGRIAARHTVIAPDTLGFGDSVPHPLRAPTISDYADTLCRTLDALELDRIDLYGSHTGACIAAELAIARPDRVGRMVLDGVGLFEGEFQERLLAHYAPSFAPDADGSYLVRAYQFCRDQALFWPWFDRTRAARRDGGLLPPDRLHSWLVEVLKAAETYPLGYRAAFSWPVKERLALVATPTLFLCALDDPLAEDTERLAPLVSNSRFTALPHSTDAGFAAARAQSIFTHFE